MSESMSYEPTPKTKRRVVHKDGRHGVVIEDDGFGTLTIQWGTTNRRNSSTGEDEAIPVTELVWCHDVTTFEEPVYFGTETEHNRELVYNPLEHL